MKQKLSKKEKVQISLFALSVILIIFGLMFMLTAADLAVIFPAMQNIEHLLVQYVIVIITMMCGIMLFSNVAATLEKPKLRNGFTIGITAFSTILTLPLLYVFLACFAAMKGLIGPFGKIMVEKVFLDFVVIFPSEGAQIAIFIAGTILSIIFLAVPLVTGVLTVQNKKLSIGKGGIKIVPKESKCECEACEAGCVSPECAAEVSADKEE